MEPLPDRLPLVIGVTGHRDLRDADVAQLEREVAAIIARLRRDYLGGEGTPIVVLSALAEGADRLVARIALEQGAQLVAPLPMPLEEYRRDFEPGLKPGNMAEFDALLAQAIAAPVMPLHGVPLEALRSDRNLRNDQYRKVGIFLNRHCHVLLALWDGDDTSISAGGSAEVVKFKRSGIPLGLGGSARASLDASEIGPVIEIVTPRMKEASGADHVSVRPWGRPVVARYRGRIGHRVWRGLVSFCGRVLHREIADKRTALGPGARRELDAWEQFASITSLTRKFNRDAARLAAAANGPTRLKQSLDGLFSDESGSDGAAQRHALELAPLWCRLYTVADTLAIDRQAEFKWDWKRLIAVGFIAFLCFAIFTQAGYFLNAVFLVGYIATFATGVLIYLGAARRQDQERYLDYRAFAEALRIAVYWTLLGIGRVHLDAKAEPARADQIGANAVGMVANAYPITEPGELAWVKVSLRTIEWLAGPDGESAEVIDPAGHALARRFWVQGQFAYYKRQSYRHNNFVESIKAWSNLLLLVPTAVLIPVLLALMLRRMEIYWYGFDVQHVIIATLALLPSVAAVLTGYSERLALSAQVRQYDRMRMLFERACALLPDKLDPVSAALARALYHELGMEAMKENAEWVAIYRQRPITPPR